MIERYTVPEMGKVWSLQNRFQKLLDVEIAVARAQARLKIIPHKAFQAIEKKASFSVDRISQIEKTTQHDVIAFVSNVAETVGEYGRYVHFGLTSSDVLDTAISLQLREAYDLLDLELEAVESALRKLVKKYAQTLCAGRTHGIHAEITTFGFKMAGFLAELERNRRRCKNSVEQASIVKLSGAVGTYSSLDPECEKLVAKDLGLKAETVATQVIPRDRFAEVFCALGILGAGFERLAIEIRHLQRTEVGEVQEPFRAGQKGSSAMPHKRNPIVSENITGVSRLLRSYVVPALENVALWHERDISHSAVERVIFPDAFILAHYASRKLTGLLNDLQVNEKKMLQNLEITQGQIFSSHVLLELVKAGDSREEAYALVQKHAHGLKEGDHLENSLLRDPAVTSKVSPKILREIFSGKTFQKSVASVIAKVLR